MTSHAFVTSMSESGFQTYGEAMLQSWAEHNSHLPLWVFYEGTCPRLPGFQYSALDLDTDLAEFRGRWGKDTVANGVVGTKGDQLIADYRWQATRFAPKVFAVTTQRRPATDWWVWIDADTEIIKTFDEKLLNAALPENALFSTLQRTESWPHSECGWVGYRHAHPMVKVVLKQFRDQYTSDRIYLEKQWHDSWLFDRMTDGLPVHDITLDTKVPKGEADHPWPYTILGPYVRHDKGQRKRRDDA